MAVADTAGATVTFDGNSVGTITDIRFRLGECQEYEVVAISTPVRGTGTYAVPFSRVLVGSAKPGSLSVTGIGLDAWFSITKLGWYGPLVIAHPAMTTLTVQAFLKSIERQAKVNDVWRYTLEFQFTEYP